MGARRRRGGGGGGGGRPGTAGARRPNHAGCVPASLAPGITHLQPPLAGHVGKAIKPRGGG
ncbi:hypothetical protein, partial [Nocardia abscessus]|uniref:hypothetical protein n=1 Tax=Nocardia abscessus TaxID=120957 RepID=UPI002457545D